MRLPWEDEYESGMNNRYMYVGKTSASHFASLKWSDGSASPYFWFCFPASSFKFCRRLGLMCLSFCILKSSNNLKIDSIESFIPQWREFPLFWKGILNNLLYSLCAEHSMSLRNITHKVTCGKIMLRLVFRAFSLNITTADAFSLLFFSRLSSQICFVALYFNMSPLLCSTVPGPRLGHREAKYINLGYCVNL